MYENLAIIAIFAFLYSLLAARLERTWFSGPVVFISFGLLFGPVGFGFLQLDVTSEVLRTLAELTLAIVLFNDAASANIRVLKSSFHIPERLLLIGLPLTIVLGAGIGFLLFDELTMYEVIILSIMLAATDAALGQAVITNLAVPARLREGLNVESGLNDGLCVPFLFLFIALALDTAGSGGGAELAFHLVAEEIGIGLAVGVSLTAIAGWMIKQSTSREWLSETWREITVITLAFSCFALAQSWGGSGFIAAFAGGLLFGQITKQQKHALLRASEGTGSIFALITWVIFGAAVISKAIEQISWSIALYSILSLTLVRMFPVFLSLAGTGEQLRNKLFLGWFGPRGLASIVFTIIVLNENLPGGNTMAVVVVCTISLSIILHGISASPLATAIGSDPQPKNSRH